MKEKKVLLIVDPQNGFKNKNTTNALKRVDEISDYFDTVFVSKFKNLRGSMYKKLLHWNHFSSNKHEEYSNLAIKKTAKMRTFYTYGYGKATWKLRLYLAIHRVKKVYVCGLQTDAGVLKTALDLFDYGITPVVIKDACGSYRGKPFHDAGLKIITRQIGEAQVVTFDELKEKIEPKVVEILM